MKDKNRYLTDIALALALMLIIVVSCKKDEKKEEEKNTPAAPSAYTDSVSYISQTWTTLNAIVTPGYLMTTVKFEYDTSTAYTHTVSANPDTISGKTSGKRSIEITGLKPNTRYHFRAVATNSMGTSIGSDRTFTTLAEYTPDIVFNTDLVYDQVTDIQGRTYKTIQLGSQVWMAENLATRQYNDGTTIPQVSNPTFWQALTDGALCWYENSSTLYGSLYNWHAVNSGKLCPAGWHVPTDEEWNTMIAAVGGINIAGGKLKEAGTLHWLTPNTGAENSTGFTAVPGGYRYYTGTFSNSKRYGYWWTGNESTSTNGYVRAMNYSYTYIDRLSFDKRSGASVRCIKD